MIYFIESESGHVKIGYTRNNVNGRLAALQGGNPHKLFLRKTIDGNTEQEKLIHKKFKHLRCKGEWFKLEQEITDFIKSPYTIIVKPKIKKPKIERKVRADYKKASINDNKCQAFLRSCMSTTGMSIADLAKKTKLTKQFIYNILNGSSKIGASSARKLHKTLGVSYDKII